MNRLKINPIKGENIQIQAFALKNDHWLLKAGIILFALIIASGCTIRLVYNHLDWIIPWYISDYISLSDAQDSELEKRLLKLLTWHRSTQLTHYSQLVRQIRDSFVQGLTRKDLDHFHLKLRRSWQLLIRQAAPDLASLLSGASDNQIKELTENLKKRQDRFKKKYIDPPQDELRKKKKKRMEKFLDFIIGDLNDQQKKLIEKWSFELKPIASERLAYIKEWQNGFVQMLKGRHNHQQFTTALQQRLFFKRSSWPLPFKTKADFNRKLTKRFFLGLEKSLTTKQKKQAVSNLNELADLLDELAKMKTDD